MTDDWAKESNFRELRELNEQVKHIDREFTILARAKSRTYERAITIIEAQFKDEILEIDKVEDVEIELDHDPESQSGKTVAFRIDHSYEGEMPYKEWDEKSKRIKEEVKEIFRQPFDDFSAFEIFVDVKFGDVSLE